MLLAASVAASDGESVRAAIAALRKKSATFQTVECPDCGAQFERRVTPFGMPSVCGECARIVNGVAVHREEVAAAIALRELLLVRA